MKRKHVQLTGGLQDMLLPPSTTVMPCIVTVILSKKLVVMRRRILKNIKEDLCFRRVKKSSIQESFT